MHNANVVATAVLMWLLLCALLSGMRPPRRKCDPLDDAAFYQAFYQTTHRQMNEHQDVPRYFGEF